jgi:hypothetical protein
MENKKRSDMEECVIKYKDNFYLKTEVGYKKIILTTDQDLIADGVQETSEEFLQWFVKNPSCEEVEVNDWIDTDGNIAFGGDKRYQICNHLREKIIIPKEEPKQENFYEDLLKYFETTPREKVLEDWNKSAHLDNVRPTVNEFLENINKQKETLEEAARNYKDLKLPDDLYDGFIAGAKWQAERMYSEEEVETIARDAYSMGRNNILIGVFNKWFETFKKK